MELLQKILAEIHFTEEVNFDLTNEKIVELDIYDIKKYEKHDVSHRKFLENYQYRKRSDGDNYVSLDIRIKKTSSQVVLEIIKDILLKSNKDKIKNPDFHGFKENQTILSFNIDQTTRLDLIKADESLSIQIIRHDGSHFNIEKA